MKLFIKIMVVLLIVASIVTGEVVVASEKEVENEENLRALMTLYQEGANYLAILKKLNFLPGLSSRDKGSINMEVQGIDLGRMKIMFPFKAVYSISLRDNTTCIFMYSLIKVSKFGAWELIEATKENIKQM